ncbi:MAG: DUF2935 domain-containing protein [Lachnospiraceae bacterium]
MTINFISLSLETHLFFARIMKEHSFFLQAGFPCTNTGWIDRGSFFRKQFEELLQEVVQLSSDSARGFISSPVLTSGELVTDYTLPAEEMTSRLTEVPFNLSLTRQELSLTTSSLNGFPSLPDRKLAMKVQQINQRALRLINDLIHYKENILKEVKRGNLFTFNYPLLIQHIIREARLYSFTIECLMNNRPISRQDLLGTPEFWNQIMMEHSQFTRGLLDPSEEALILTANSFALDYRQLLSEANCRDSMVNAGLNRRSLEETLALRNFKSAGAKGILNGEIASIILPLLADHVLREANHYIRILEN